MTENDNTQQDSKAPSDETEANELSAEKSEQETAASPEAGKKAAAKADETKAAEPAAETDADSENLSDTPDPLELLEAENAALKEKILRINADMENLRRRTEREKQDMAKFAITGFARDIISVDDNLNRALEAVPEDAVESDPALKALVDGVEMTGRELANVLERNGITRLDPKGEIFDPNAHQAMFEMPNPEVPAGTIMEVVATGFMIEGRILRPAMVGIAKGGKKPEKESAEAPAEEKAEQQKAAEKSDGDDKSNAADEKASNAEPGDNIDKAV